MFQIKILKKGIFCLRLRLAFVPNKSRVANGRLRGDTEDAAKMPKMKFLEVNGGPLCGCIGLLLRRQIKMLCVALSCGDCVWSDGMALQKKREHLEDCWIRFPRRILFAALSIMVAALSMDWIHNATSLTRLICLIVWENMAGVTATLAGVWRSEGAFKWRMSIGRPPGRPRRKDEGGWNWKRFCEHSFSSCEMDAFVVSAN